ncbi:hypothetical protein [Bacillus sp. AFS017336]|uniref:hypothetical protein n=1 Tax=Bacillus sp. AFS017336 TaxID=2033489 RepID=UPI0015CF2ACF|nr:hypothetical protein [Bacillus sp. AFS017336]
MKKIMKYMSHIFILIMVLDLGIKSLEHISINKSSLLIETLDEDPKDPGTR